MLDLGRIRPQDWGGWNHPFRHLRLHLHEGHVDRQPDDGHTALGDGDADRALEDLRQLFGTGNQFDVMAALLEQVLRMCGLEIVDTNFAARDVRSNSQYRHAITLAI